MYFSKNPKTRYLENQFDHMLLGNNITFLTAGSVFSSRKIDKGTETLIKYAKVKEGWKLLDLGCGYGPVGIALAKANPGCKIVMSDINQRAVKLAYSNIKLNNIDNAVVISGNLFENIPGKFDSILLNPPQCAGKKLCLSMIEQSREHLPPGGLLQVVARHNKGGKEFMKKMAESFGNVETAGRKSGYHVYVSKA